MFCYQCQETAGNTGCTQVGVCGKKPEVAKMQDLLIYVSKGISAITTRLRAEGKEVSKEVNHLVTLNLFITITNANFDNDAIIAPDYLEAKYKKALAYKASGDVETANNLFTEIITAAPEDKFAKEAQRERGY